MISPASALGGSAFLEGGRGRSAGQTWRPPSARQCMACSNFGGGVALTSSILPSASNMIGFNT
eukprot:7482826-Alexandrium_andersonii.AAC.1